MLRHSMSVILAVAAALAATLLGDQVAETPKDREVKQAETAVSHLEQQWLDALNKADVNAIAGILADDFARPAPDSGRFVNKADLLRFYRSHLSPQVSDLRRIEDMKVTVYGETALARGVLLTRDSQGRITRKLLFTDVFLRQAGKWQAISAQENVVKLPSAEKY
jgi:ketosteroid isomerase-like protein